MTWERIKSFFARFTRPGDPSSGRQLYVPMMPAGIFVDNATAMTNSAFFRAVAYISQAVAGLPWSVIRETSKGSIPQPNHAVAGLLKSRPNPEMGAFVWRETMLAWALTWGNGYSEIELDMAGRPIALWPLAPDRVEVKRLPDTQELIYEISNYVGGTVYLPPERVFHLHGLGFDGLVGYPIVALAARGIGLGLAAERFNEDFYNNGTVTTGVIKVPKILSTEAYDRLKKDWAEKNSKFGQKWRPIFFDGGMEWQSISMPIKDAQMLETRKFQVTEIARWFGLPPHKLADLERATFSNIEHQSIEVVNDALMPWVHRFEQEADGKLFGPRDRSLRTKLNVRGLLRGDDKSRAEYYKIMRDIGVYSTNMILRLEDENPVGPEGDELLVQLNQTTLKKLVAGDSGPSKVPAVPPGKPAPAEALMPALNAAFERIFKREIGQFGQVSVKFGENMSDFNKWADGFFEKHRVYMTDVLRPMVDSLIALFPENIDLKSAQAAMDRLISIHMVETRDGMMAALAQKRPLELDNSRIRASAQEFIEAVVAAGSVKNGE